MKRDSFIFYRSFAKGIGELDEELRGICYDAIIQYALDGIEPELSGVPKAIFELVRPQIDANNLRYENGKKGAEFGKLGGRPKKNPIGVITENPIGVFDENPKETPNVNVNENENVNVKEKEEEKEKKVANAPRFKKPTLEEVREYCRERKNDVNAESFIDFYESKGWKVGNQPMKDWKACVRTWERRDKSVQRTTNKFLNFEQRTYDMDELERKLLDN